MSKLTPLDKAKRVLAKLYDRQERVKKREDKSANGLGWGYAYRAYHRIKRMNLSDGSSIRDQVEAAENEVYALSGFNPEQMDAHRRHRREMTARFGGADRLPF